MSSAGIALSPVPEDPALSPIRFDGSRSPHCASEDIVIYLSCTSRSPVIPLRVLPSESIASVKFRIQTFKGFVVKKQKLIFDGRELARNNCLVRDYGVCDGNVLHLVLRLSDLRIITVRTTFGREYKFHVEQGRNVRYVKQQIAQNASDLADLEEQKIICHGEELDDQCLIEHISDDEDGVIHLLVHKSAKVRTKSLEKDFEVSIVAPDLSELEAFEDLEIVEDKQLERNILFEPVIVNPKAELPSVVNNLVSAALAGLKKGNSPVRTSEGSGGAYFMQDMSGQGHVAVFKPIDEEPMAVNNPQGLPPSKDGEGLKRGTRVGEGALREVAAYLLDYPIGGERTAFSEKVLGFAGVPPTVMIRCLHEGFNHPHGYKSAPENVKIGSLQMFVSNIGSCEDMGPRAFPVEEVHKISVLDIRLANADRHAGNMLVCKEQGGKLSLVPIDHGYCLPENFEDCTFEWLYWPQSRVPYTAETINYIRSLDAEEDIALLKFHGWELSLGCARTLRISTMLLKKGVDKGLTPFTIGSIMCRETLKKKSLIEEFIEEATNSVLPGTSEAAFLESVSEIMDRYLDELSM